MGSVNRRTAGAVVGVIAFMPTWALLPLLLCGLPGTALYVNSALIVVSGIACLTSTGCPTMYAFANDLIHPADRELAFGLAFAVGVLVVLAVNLLGVLVALLSGGNSVAVVAYAVVLSFVFFWLIATIRMPWEQDNQAQHAVGAKALIADGIDHSADESSSVSSRSFGVESGERRLPSMLAPFRLACGYAPLRNTCLVIALVSIPETACYDVNSQYVLDLLGLLGAEGKHGQQRVQVVQSLMTYPGQLLLFPAFYVVGVVAQRMGALQLVRRLVLPIAILQTLPILLLWYPRLWAVVLEGICLALTFVIFPPLQTVTAHVAPKDRVAEAMSAVGASKQLAALAGNVLVSVLSPVLLSSSIQRPLALVFLLCGCLCLIAVPFAGKIEIPTLQDDVELSFVASAKSDGEGSTTSGATPPSAAATGLL